MDISSKRAPDNPTLDSLKKINPEKDTKDTDEYMIIASPSEIHLEEKNLKVGSVRRPLQWMLPLFLQTGDKPSIEDVFPAKQLPNPLKRVGDKDSLQKNFQKELEKIGFAPNEQMNREFNQLAGMIKDMVASLSISVSEGDKIRSYKPLEILIKYVPNSIGRIEEIQAEIIDCLAEIENKCAEAVTETFIKLIEQKRSEPQIVEGKPIGRKQDQVGIENNAELIEFEAAPEIDIEQYKAALLKNSKQEELREAILKTSEANIKLCELYTYTVATVLAAGVEINGKNESRPGSEAEGIQMLVQVLTRFQMPAAELKKKYGFIKESIEDDKNKWNIEIAPLEVLSNACSMLVDQDLDRKIKKEFKKSFKSMVDLLNSKGGEADLGSKLNKNLETTLASLEEKLKNEKNKGKSESPTIKNLELYIGSIRSFPKCILELHEKIKESDLKSWESIN
jgi:uncharacterized protein YlxP (DUF503 family)